jgi:hypothetical protein
VAAMSVLDRTVGGACVGGHRWLSNAARPIATPRTQHRPAGLPRRLCDAFFISSLVSV